MTFTPGFFKSLTESCYNPDFYRRIPAISLKRSAGFLFLLSLTVALFSLVLLSMYFSKQEARSGELLELYDQYVPPFQMTVEKNTLQTIPSQLSKYFWFNSSQQLQISDLPRDDAFFTIRIDSQSTRAQLFEQALLPGMYLLQDTIVLHTAFQDTVLEYSTLQLPEGVAFSKETIRPELAKLLPEILSWVKGIPLQVGTVLIFFYTFISSWLIAVFTSLFGMFILLVRQKRIDYSFLIKLSFYASVPAFLIFFLTYLLSISVSFLPFLIYLSFYSYGVMVVEK